MRHLRPVLACLLVGAPVTLAWLGRRALLDYEMRVTPWLAGEKGRFVDIPQGARGVDAVRALVEAGVLRAEGPALKVLERSGQARSLQAGEYLFDRPLTPAEVLERLIAGDVYRRRFQVPEGLNRFEIARRFEAALLGSAAEFLEASRNVSLIAELDPAAEDLEGYLFPATYELGRREGAAGLVRRMVERFREAAGPGLGARARGSGLSVRELVTLASLVEKETGRPEERPVVAGVYRARLRRGMLLQADPSVIYGLAREGRFDGNLKRVHLREPQPYNTYVNPGLPPGPIANPGLSALEAALAPADTDYLYFVSRNDGTHVFSRTLAEHNRRVQKYQRDYWRSRWRSQGRPER